MNRPDVRPMVAQLTDALAGWLLDNDVDTQEKVSITYQLLLALAVSVLSSAIIATPPPWHRGFALVLPAQLWAVLIISAVMVQLVGRRRQDWCVRRVGAIGAVVICGMLSPSLWPEAPGLGTVVVAAVFFQAILAARLAHICKQRGEGQ